MALAKNKPAAPPPAPEKDEIIYEASAPLWMVTMGDAMSLMLTFFVMLMTFSTPDTGKLMDAIGSMKGALGILEWGAGGERDKPADRENKTESKGDLEGGGREEVQVDKDNLTSVNLRTLEVANRYNLFKERLLELGFDKFVSTHHFETGIMIRIDFDRLFVPGTTQMNQDAPVMLQSFGNLVGSVGNEVQMMANFTENEGEGKRYSSQWNQARARLEAVGNLFSTKFQVAKSRVSYGFKMLADEAPAFLTILLAEKVGTNEITMSELINIREE